MTGPFVLPPEAVATTSSRYAELGLLGEGGMGKVHLCRDARIGREVAMKVILPEGDARERIRVGARKWPLVFASWVAFVPLFIWAGVRDLTASAFGLGMMAVAMFFGLARSRRGSAAWMEYAALVCSAVAMVAVGRALGPLVLMPTLLATFVAGIQLHPHRRARLFALGVGVVGLVGAVAFDLSGILPRGGGASGAFALPGTGRDLPMTVVILLANLSSMVTTALLVSNFRAELTRAEERLLLHSWQVRGMMPANVAQRSGEQR